jgi:hypothetical protein
VINSSVQQYKLAVYATDAINDDAGGLTLLPAGENPTDAGSWITLGGTAASGFVTVEPRSFVVVPIKGVIPSNATPGDHVAGLVADLTTVSRDNNVNVRLHQRVGLRMFVHVAGDLHPSLAIEDLAIDYRDNWNPIGAGAVTVTYRVRNTGNVVLGAKQDVAIDGLFGETAAATPPDIPLLLPGAAVDVTVPVSGVLPEFWMTGKVTLTPFAQEGAVVPDNLLASARAHFWAIPWVLLGTLLALLGGVFGYWRWRRTHPKSTGRHSTPKNGDRAVPAVDKQKVLA